MAMATGLVVHLWKEWGIQILVVISFLLQVILLIFAGTRRRSSSAVLRIFLWLVYLLADNVALYALGHMSLNSRPEEDRLVAFWAPLFLLHLGGQDTITAYSLEDNQLWKRHLLTLLVQVSGAGYVLYLYIGNSTPTFVSATILTFTVGLLKYGERVLALKLADIESLGTSLDIPDGAYGVLDRRGDMDAEQEVLLGAHYMFSLCRTSFFGHKPIDGAYGSSRAIRQSKHYNGAMYLYGLVEVELSLMYDLLYTKAPVIHTWYGCCIRVVLPLATVSAFLLFHLGGTGAYNRVDIAITYAMLVGAMILEITSLLRALGSTWTCAFLHARKWDRYYAAAMWLRRPVKAEGNRRFLHSMGQHSVLDFCVRDKTKLRDRIAKAMGLGKWWNKQHYSSTTPITLEFKELLMAQILKVMHDPSKSQIREVRGRAALTEYGIFDDVSWSVEIDLEECILIWHIATHIYLCCCPQPNEGEEEPPLVKAIRTLSRYMAFLLLVRPSLLQGGGGRRSIWDDNYPDLELYWQQLCTSEELRQELCARPYTFFSTKKLSSGEQKAMSMLQNVCRQSAGEDEDSSTWLSRAMAFSILQTALWKQYTGNDVHGFQTCTTGEEEDPMLPSTDILARYLLHMYSDDTSSGNAYYKGTHLASMLLRNTWNLPNMPQVIFALWVELLCHAASQSPDVAHARQLGKGGDFLTAIYILMSHIQLFTYEWPDHTDQV